MVSQGFFDHTWPNGLTFERRISRSGFAGRAQRWCAGENLVWGRGSQSTPQSLVGAWIQSPAHLRNLLSPRYRRIGVAAVAGTPFDAGDPNGITVSSEYGSRSC